MARKESKVATRSKRSGASSRRASAGPWSRREVLALLRAWGEIARDPVAAMKTTVGADAALLFEKFQRAMIDEAGDDGDLPPTRRSKDAVRTKMKRIELSFKSIQMYLKRQQQQPVLHLNDAVSLDAVESAREDWFALSKEQQLNALVSITPGFSRSSFAEIDKEAFGLMETISGVTAQEAKQASPDGSAKCRDPRTKWSTLDVRNLVRACLEALELNPNVRADPSFMFKRFNELSNGNSRTLSAFIRKARMIMRTYKMFQAFDQVQSRDANAKSSCEQDLPERIREFYQQRDRASRLPNMDADVFVALGEIEYMMDSISSPTRQDRSSLPQEEHNDSDDSSSSSMGVKRYRIKKGVCNRIDLIECGSCTSESEDDVRCLKKSRASPMATQVLDLEVSHTSTSVEDGGVIDAEEPSASSQVSMAISISVSNDDETTSFDNADELNMLSSARVRVSGCSAESDDNQGCPSIAVLIDGSKLPYVPPRIVGQSHQSLHPVTLKMANPCGEQMQCVINLVEQVNAQRQLCRDEIRQIFSDFQAETRRDRDEVLDTIRRVRDEQRRDRADTLRILGTLTQIESELRRLRYGF